MTETSDLTIGEAAAFLGVHPGTLRKWTDDGRVPVWVAPSGHRRYRRSDLVALLPSGGSETVA